MDGDARAQLTSALDTSIAKVLRERKNVLVSMDSADKVASQIVSGLRSLQNLEKGIPPDYSAPWISELYVAWHQLTHINMAYTLTNLVPAENNPLVSDMGGLHIQDFGCGPFAMQFGFVLGIANNIQHDGSAVFSIYGHDDSGEMWNLGLQTYRDLRSEIDNEQSYPALSRLRQVMDGLKYRAPTPPFPRSTNWLSILHAAYPGTPGESIECEVSRRLENQRPKVVLVTANPHNSEYMYEPPSKEYEVWAECKKGPNLDLAGDFGEISEWRANLFHEFIEPHGPSLGSEDVDFAKRYLNQYRTAWESHNFGWVYSMYVRR